MNNPADSGRLQIWQALSLFFLDSEVDQVVFDHVARVIEQSGYTTTQVHSMLWLEVFPVLKANLQSVAGEWAGWSDAWLLDNMKVSEQGVARPARGRVADEIARCWTEVLARVNATGSTDRR